MTVFVILVIAIVVIGLVVGLVALVNGRKQPPPQVPPAAPTGTITDEPPVEAPEVPEEPQAPVTTLERPEGTASRLVRLRQRLARSQGGLGRGLLELLSRERLDEDTWEEIEDTLITADVGVAPDPGARREAAHPPARRGRRRGERPRRSSARSCSRWSTPPWTAGSR